MCAYAYAHALYDIILCVCVCVCVCVGVSNLWDMGYAASDIITTIFRVVKNFESADMTEWSRLEFIKEIGFTHVRILDGLDSFVQLTALVARLCRLGMKEKFDH